MSYFTETFESILEFKHDIAASYSARNAADKLSGDHKIGKASQTIAKIYNAGSDLENGRNSRGYVRSKVDAKTVKKYADTIANNKDAAKAARSGMGYYASRNAKDGKILSSANKISNRGITVKNIDKRLKEGYDPIYNDLVNMGIID